VQLSSTFSGLSLRQRNALLIGDLYNIGQAIKTQMAQLKENMAVFREAVRRLRPAARWSTVVFRELEESNELEEGPCHGGNT
jgi:hypothetical protein